MEQALPEKKSPVKHIWRRVIAAAIAVILLLNLLLVNAIRITIKRTDETDTASAATNYLADNTEYVSMSALQRLRTLLRQTEQDRADSFEGHYEAASVAIAKGDNAAALDEINACLAIVTPVYGGYEDLLMKKGCLLALLGEDERAKNVFSEVLDRNPKNADAMLLQSQLYLQNADIGKAKELLSTFLQLQEGDANQLAVMAQLCYGTGDHEGTLSYGRLSLEKAPSEDGQLYRAMAYAAMLQNGFAEAREYLTRALELLGEDAEMLYYRGVCSLSFEEYESALSDFTAAIDGGMEEGLVYYNRAVCYLAFEDWEPFRADLERVVELNDDAELKGIAESLLKELEGTGQQEQ